MRKLAICTVILGLSWMASPTSQVLAATPEKAAAKQLGESVNGKTVSVLQGTSMEIRLDGNITTGYSWTVTGLSGNSLQQVGKVDYLPLSTSPGKVGAPGTFVARFKAATPGASTIKMAYARPWEHGKPPAKTFSVEVNVAK